VQCNLDDLYHSRQSRVTQEAVCVVHSYISLSYCTWHVVERPLACDETGIQLQAVEDKQLKGLEMAKGGHERRR
jgi:hypothetical protein